MTLADNICMNGRYWVAGESRRTIQDRPKALLYAENAARFERFADKILHLPLDMTTEDLVRASACEPVICNFLKPPAQCGELCIYEFYVLLPGLLWCWDAINWQVTKNKWEVEHCAMQVANRLWLQKVKKENGTNIDQKIQRYGPLDEPFYRQESPNNALFRYPAASLPNT